MLSIILTTAVLFPDISSGAIIAILVGGSAVGIAIAAVVKLIQAKRDKAAGKTAEVKVHITDTANWRMPPLDQLRPLNLTVEKLVWMGVLRGYLIVAICLVAYKVVRMALG